MCYEIKADNGKQRIPRAWRHRFNSVTLRSRKNAKTVIIALTKIFANAAHRRSAHSFYNFVRYYTRPEWAKSEAKSLIKFPQNDNQPVRHSRREVDFSPDNALCLAARRRRRRTYIIWSELVLDGVNLISSRTPGKFGYIKVKQWIFRIEKTAAGSLRSKPSPMPSQIIKPNSCRCGNANLTGFSRL